MCSRRSLIKILAPYMIPSLEKTAEENYEEYFATDCPKERRMLVIKCLEQLNVNERVLGPAREYFIMRMRNRHETVKREMERRIRYQEKLNKSLVVEDDLMAREKEITRRRAFPEQRKAKRKADPDFHVDHHADERVHDQHLGGIDNVAESEPIEEGEAEVVVVEDQREVEEEEQVDEEIQQESVIDQEAAEEYATEPPQCGEVIKDVRLHDIIEEEQFAELLDETAETPNRVMKIVREEVEVEDGEESEEEVVEVVVYHVRRKKRKKNSDPQLIVDQ